jgi:hypothetical protein
MCPSSSSADNASVATPAGAPTAARQQCLNNIACRCPCRSTRCAQSSAGRCPSKSVSIACRNAPPAAPIVTCYAQRRQCLSRAAPTGASAASPAGASPASPAGASAAAPAVLSNIAGRCPKSSRAGSASATASAVLRSSTRSAQQQRPQVPKQQRRQCSAVELGRCPSSRSAGSASVAVPAGAPAAAPAVPQQQ